MNVTPVRDGRDLGHCGDGLRPGPLRLISAEGATTAGSPVRSAALNAFPDVGRHGTGSAPVAAGGVRSRASAPLETIHRRGGGSESWTSNRARDLGSRPLGLCTDLGLFVRVWRVRFLREVM